MSSRKQNLSNARDGRCPRETWLLRRLVDERILALLAMLLFWFTPMPGRAHDNTEKVEVVVATGHSVGVFGVAFSPDGRTIASGSMDKTLKLWDAASGRELRTLTGHSHWVFAVAFSPDGRTIVSGSADKTLKLWDAASGQELRTLTGHSEIVSAVAFSPDGRTIVSGSSDKTLKLWDAASGRELRTLTGHSDVVRALAISPDGRTIVSGSFDKTLKLWEAASGRELKTLVGHSDAVYAVAFSPDGRTIVSGSADKTLKLWEAASGRELHMLTGHSDAMRAVAFSPDGRTIVSGSADSTLKLWDVSGRELRTLTGHSRTVAAVAFSPDGRIIVSGSWDTTLKLWDAASKQELHTLTGQSNWIFAVAFSPDGRTIVSGSADNPLKLWETASGRELRALTGHSGGVYAVAFSPDGRTIVSGGADKTLKLWDAASGRELRTLTGHSDVVRAVAFSPDGRTIVSGSFDKTLKLWEAASGRELRTLTGHSGDVRAVAFSPDGRAIVSGGADKTLKLWETASGRELRTLTGHSDAVYAVAFSPDGRTIVSGSLDQTLKLWETASGRELRTLTGHSGTVSAVAFSPDGSTIVSGSWDTTLKLWDAATGRELRALTGHSVQVFAVAFSPNGRIALSGSMDGSAGLWDVASGQEHVRLLSFADGSWLAFTPEGFFDASAPKAAQKLNVVRGFEASSIDQVYNALYRPDLVREKLAGDPDGKVKAAAAKLDLEKVMASGSAPKVTIMSPVSGSSSATDEATVEATVSDRGGGIGKVEWRVNGVTSGIETRGLERVEAAASAERSLTVKRTLALERGENRIEVLAHNAKDLIASEPASVTVTWDGEKTATPPKLFVMAVGVNDYYDSRLRLSYAVPDATAIAEGFRKAGTGLYAAVDVTTVLETDVTIANLDKVFAELGKKAQPRDVFVFFLAGHGKTKNGRYYFLPRDFRYEDEDSIEKVGMDQDKFQAWFAKIPARKSILLYDTCESGSLTGTKARGSDIDERLGALNRMTRATGRTFLTATTDDAPALEGYHGHGVFTYAILDALDHADANKNGLIEVSELADYIDQKVPDISFEAFKLRQIPQRNIVGNNFALTNKTNILIAANNPPANLTKSIAGVHIGEAGSSDTTIPSKPTHVVITSTPMDVFESISLDGTKGPTIEKLSIGMSVVVIKSTSGWDLVARDGKSLGYVDHAGLAPLW